MKAAPAILPSNKPKSGMYVVYIRISMGQDRKFYDTGISVKKTWWNEKTKQPDRKVRDTCPDADTYNSTLRRLVGDAFVIYEQFLNAGTLPTATMVRKELELLHKYGGHRPVEATDEVTDLFWPVADMHVSSFSNIASATTASAQLMQLKEFAPTLRFSDITPLFLAKYQNYLFSKGLVHSTVERKMIRIRAVCNVAVANGIIAASPWRHKPPKPTQRAPVYLDVQEMAQLEAAQLTGIQAIARDLLLFGYYAHGLRISDRIMLTWEQVDGHYIRLVAKKNRKLKTIAINSKLAGLLSKYSGAGGKYVFPLGQKDKTELDRHNTVSRITASVNKALGNIAKKLEINKKITTHVARHTLGNKLLREGHGLEIIASVLGIDVKTAKVYAGKFPQEQLDSVMRDIYGE